MKTKGLLECRGEARMSLKIKELEARRLRKSPRDTPCSADISPATPMTSNSAGLNGRVSPGKGSSAPGYSLRAARTKSADFAGSKGERA